MKTIYIKPVTEKVNLHLKDDVNFGEHGIISQERNYTANESTFFDEEEVDDDYDPFFDE